MSSAVRKEKDFLGEIGVPAHAYYGIFTVRASQNFPVSGIRANARFIKSLALIKKACATANLKLKLLDRPLAEAIIQAAQEVSEGKFQDQFILDVFQAGAGTPFNMNMNEVLANRANEILGKPLGSYDPVHPNNHVNMAQSSNDVVPTAIRITSLMLSYQLVVRMNSLILSLEEKSSQYRNLIKVGRTHLQDAVPISFGQVLHGWSSSLFRSLKRLDGVKFSLAELGVGGTAIGTGLNTHPDFKRHVVQELVKLTGYELRPSEESIELTSSMAVFVELSGAIRELTIELNRVANDLRLLSSGPKAGFAELVLPEVEPGSSIMPGKVNPSIPEAVNMVCYQVMGNDHAVSLAAQNGQLELNVMTPVMAFNLFWSMELLIRAVRILDEKCIRGLHVNEEKVRRDLEESMTIATVLNPYLGYEVVSHLVKKSLKEQKPFLQVVKEEKLISEELLTAILRPEKMIHPLPVDTELAHKIKESDEFKKFKKTL